MWMFELLSVCDWISPLAETAKDVHHAIVDGEGTTPISVDKRSLYIARRALKSAGIDVISESTGWGKEAMLDVRDSQADRARYILQNL